jgi:hypothetical protein
VSISCLLSVCITLKTAVSILASFPVVSVLSALHAASVLSAILITKDKTLTKSSHTPDLNQVHLGLFSPSAISAATEYRRYLYATRESSSRHHKQTVCVETRAFQTASAGVQMSQSIATSSLSPLEQGCHRLLYLQRRFCSEIKPLHLLRQHLPALQTGRLKQSHPANASALVATPNRSLNTVAMNISFATPEDDAPGADASASVQCPRQVTDTNSSGWKQMGQHQLSS